MSVKMKLGSKDIPFVYKGDKLIYPNPIKDGLLLWYDFKGIRNTDTNKEVAKDLSGKGNDGTLTNFNFTEGSGYKDNTLVFDGVDDSLTIPELELDETAMSVVHDGKLYAYEDDKVLTVGEDGEIIEGGKNLVKNSNNLTFTNFSGSTHLKEIDESGYTRVSVNPGDSFIVLMIMVSHLKKDYPNREITISMDIINHGDAFNLVHNWANSSANNDIPVGFSGRYKFTGDVYEPAAGQIQFRTKHNPPINGLDFSIRNFKAEVGAENKGYSLAPSDYKSTTLSPTSLADLQLYNRPLRKNELLHNAESKGLKKLKPGVPVQDGLVLHYDFSHESNASEYKDKAFDYSGNGNHGVLNNFGYAEGSGYDGSKLKFDGIDDYIATQGFANHLPTLKDFTIQLAYKRNTYVGTTVVFGNRTGVFEGAGGKGIELRSNSNGYSFYIDDGVSYRTNLVPYQNEQTDLITLVRENGNVSTYFGGDFEKVLDFSEVGDISSGREMFLGSRPNSSYQDDGELFSFKIYSRPLTPEEIAHNYEIEKERFDITDDNNLPIGKAVIGKTNKVGGGR